MSFDPMAAAVDWLDAYRAGDIEAILEMYADDAMVYCDCDELAVSGREGLQSYWVARLQKYPVAELDNLELSYGAAMISYICGENVVKAVLSFDEAGKITTQSCDPLQRETEAKTPPKVVGTTQAVENFLPVSPSRGLA